jgi:hypothetical protein
MLTAQQMYEHQLMPTKGWFEMSALDKKAQLHSALLASLTAVPSGRVACLKSSGDESGHFVLAGFDDQAADAEGGLAAPSYEMPIFLWPGSKDFDVYNNGVPTGGAYNVAGAAYWYGIDPTGAMIGLVATGGYELQTTEFQQEDGQDESIIADYAINDPLTVVYSTDQAEAGKVTNLSQLGAGYAAFYTDWIVGQCSAHCNQKTEDARYAAGAAAPFGGIEAESLPVGYNAHSVLTLTFWTRPFPIYGSGRRA